MSIPKWRVKCVCAHLWRVRGGGGRVSNISSERITNVQNLQLIPTTKLTSTGGWGKDPRTTGYWYILDMDMAASFRSILLLSWFQRFSWEWKSSLLKSDVKHVDYILMSFKICPFHVNSPIFYMKVKVHLFMIPRPWLG